MLGLKVTCDPLSESCVQACRRLAYPCLLKGCWGCQSCSVACKQDMQQLFSIHGKSS